MSHQGPTIGALTGCRKFVCYCRPRRRKNNSTGEGGTDQSICLTSLGSTRFKRKSLRWHLQSVDYGGGPSGLCQYAIVASSATGSLPQGP